MMVLFQWIIALTVTVSDKQTKVGAFLILRFCAFTFFHLSNRFTQTDIQQQKPP